MSYQRMPFLIILSSPSGGGKGTILNKILKRTNNIEYSVSYTTRPPRGNEQNGVHYHFVTETDFKERIAAGDFLEFAQFSGNYYGTSISYIQSLLNKGKHVIMDIEIQGAAQITTTNFPYVKIFILPPTIEILKERLANRKTDSAEEIEKRLMIARYEVTQINNYDYLVINDDLDKAIEEVLSIIKAEENRVDRYSKPEREFLHE